MTHDELLAKINYNIEGNPYDEYMSALRAVVELHKPRTESNYCAKCRNAGGKLVPYPCPTIQAIEKELK